MSTSVMSSYMQTHVAYTSALISFWRCDCHSWGQSSMFSSFPSEWPAYCLSSALGTVHCSAHCWNQILCGFRLTDGFSVISPSFLPSTLVCLCLCLSLFVSVSFFLLLLQNETQKKCPMSVQLFVFCTLSWIILREKSHFFVFIYDCEKGSCQVDKKINKQNGNFKSIFQKSQQQWKSLC